MNIKILFRLFLLTGIFLPAVCAIAPNQLLYTKKTLNYRIESLYTDAKLEKEEYFDIHTNQKVANPEWIDTELVVEERFEDSDNMMVIQYDLAGKLVSKRSFKKQDASPGEIRLGENQIEALKKYDVDDEELEIIKIDWDSIIFADSNYAREIVLRWSETRDYRIKTEYSREGLILSRVVWNKHTGQKIDVDYKVSAQTVDRDIIQNFRGFMEISYNVLGKITAIRSWDRLTGKVLPPPASIPFTNRLERDFLKLDFQEHQDFEAEYFQVRKSGKQTELRDGESLFADEKKRYRFFEGAAFIPMVKNSFRGEVGYQGQGSFADRDVDAFRFRTAHQPGKYRVYNDFLHISHRGRIEGDFLVKSVRYPFGADQKATVIHNDMYVKKNTFSRNDAEIDLIGGLKFSNYHLIFRDGSRYTVFDESLALPLVGIEGTQFLSRKRKLIGRITGTKMNMGSINSSALHKSVELRQEFPVSMSRLFSCWELSIGYEHTENNLKTDTDSLRPVHFDTMLKSAHIGFNVKF